MSRIIASGLGVADTLSIEFLKFSVLETGKTAKPEDIHIGSYLRIQGEERDGNFLATDIVIWEAESHPAPG